MGAGLPGSARGSHRTHSGARSPAKGGAAARRLGGSSDPYLQSRRHATTTCHTRTVRLICGRSISHVRAGLPYFCGYSPDPVCLVTSITRTSVDGSLEGRCAPLGIPCAWGVHVLSSIALSCRSFRRDEYAFT